jgi:hypothetical protein
LGYVGQLYDPVEGRLRKAYVVVMVLSHGRKQPAIIRRAALESGIRAAGCTLAYDAASLKVAAMFYSHGESAKASRC